MLPALAILPALAGCRDWREVPAGERGFAGSLAAWITGADAARQARLDAEAAAAEAHVARLRAEAQARRPHRDDTR